MMSINVVEPHKYHMMYLIYSTFRIIILLYWSIFDKRYNNKISKYVQNNEFSTEGMAVKVLDLYLNLAIWLTFTSLKALLILSP